MSDSTGGAFVAGDLPGWARAALAHPVRSGVRTVAGADIAYRVWTGDAGRPVLLLHGGGAHAHWWDFVAPLLDGRQVVALDFSGHGDSQWREAYGPRLWTGEVRDVLGALFDVPPVVVGHSMGGVMGMLTAGAPDAPMAGMIAVDSPLVRLPTDPVETPFARPSRGTATRQELMDRFRPSPDSGLVPPWVSRHVAHHSVRLVDGRYRWKFDPRFFAFGRPENPVPAEPVCPVVYFHCEHGVVPPDVLDRVYDVPGGDRVEIRELPGVGHNPMLDIPAEFAEMLRPVLDKLESDRGRGSAA